MTEPEPAPGAAAAPARMPGLTYAVIVVSLYAYVVRSFESKPWTWEALKRWGVLDPWDVYEGGYWSLVMSVFLHQGILHLLFNLYWLWVLGRELERAVGSVRALVFFVGAAWISSALQLAVSGMTGIGLSGVGYALFGFMWMARPRFSSFRAVVTPGLVKLFLGWLLFCIVVTQVGIMNIANTAHFAGLVFGGLLGAAMLPRWRRTAIAGATLFCVAGTATVFWAPWSPTWTSGRAWKALEEKDYERAVAGFTRAIELDDGDYVAWAGRGQARRLMGDYEAALADLSKAVELEPYYHFAFLERGRVKHLTGDPAGAIADFTEALRLAPGYAWAHAGIAWVCATSRDPEVRNPARALVQAREAVRLAPSEAEFRTTLGASLYSAGNYAAALEALEAGMEMAGGGDAYNWFLVAMARHKLGMDDAREWYDKAVAWAHEHEPDDENLQRIRSQAEEVLGLG